MPTAQKPTSAKRRKTFLRKSTKLFKKDPDAQQEEKHGKSNSENEEAEHLEVQEAPSRNDTKHNTTEKTVQAESKSNKLKENEARKEDEGVEAQRESSSNVIERISSANKIERKSSRNDIQRKSSSNKIKRLPSSNSLQRKSSRNDIQRKSSRRQSFLHPQPKPEVDIQTKRYTVSTQYAAGNMGMIGYEKGTRKHSSFRFMKAKRSGSLRKSLSKSMLQRLSSKNSLISETPEKDVLIPKLLDLVVHDRWVPSQELYNILGVLLKDHNCVSCPKSQMLCTELAISAIENWKADALANKKTQKLRDVNMYYGETIERCKSWIESTTVRKSQTQRRSTIKFKHLEKIYRERESINRRESALVTSQQVFEPNSNSSTDVVNKSLSKKENIEKNRVPKFIDKKCKACYTRASISRCIENPASIQTRTLLLYNLLLDEKRKIHKEYRYKEKVQSIQTIKELKTVNSTPLETVLSRRLELMNFNSA